MFALSRNEHVARGWRVSVLLCVRPNDWVHVSVGQSVSEVDLEASECCGPVVGGPPFRFGSLDGEVDEFGSR
jgi:hypothetical protein